MNYIQYMKPGGNFGDKLKTGIKKFLKAAGEGVQEHAHKVMNDPNATPLQKKRANFAWVARHKFKHEEGGKLNYLNYFN